MDNDKAVREISQGIRFILVGPVTLLVGYGVVEMIKSIHDPANVSWAAIAGWGILAWSVTRFLWKAVD